MQLICEYGEMWARNDENIRRIPEKKGIYILYDGSMPVYVGKSSKGTASLHGRIRRARIVKSRGQFWDHFSWYVLKSPGLIHDTESLLLRTLPPYLRSRTNQKGRFKEGEECKQHTEDLRADAISRKVMR